MLTLKEISDLMKSLSDWSLDGDSISKQFVFSSFEEAIEFVNKVADVCKKEEHYPDMIIMQSVVKVVLTTRLQKCLTKKDFDVASLIDSIKE